ncbi:MAG: serine hydrolase [Anaerolineales bacterium]
MKKTSWRIAWIIVLMTGIACNLGLAGKAVPAQRTSTTSESSVMTTAPSSTSNSGAPSVQSNPDTVCDGTGCISLKKFSENIDSELQGKVVGYVSMIGSTPIISTYGQARTAANPPATAMGTSIPSNIASLSKVLTTVSVLQWLASHNLTVYAKISSYLPPDWTQGPNIDTITFKDLLTHRAGFRNDENNESYAGLQQQIADGVQLSDMATPQYNNLNFALFRILLPYMAGFSDPGPAQRATATANFYVDYMRQHIFLPLGITQADCKPAAGSDPMFYYPAPAAGLIPGVDGGDWTLTCGGGGWVLSTEDLYKILLDLMNGNKLLTDSEKAQMNSECLGWDCSVGPEVDFVGKNGILHYIYTNNNQTHDYWLETFFGIFKGKVPVVLLVNSVPPQNITGVVDNAFRNAMAPSP